MTNINLYSNVYTVQHKYLIISNFDVYYKALNV